MAIETVSFPIKNGGSFHSYVNVYQRVSQKTGARVTSGDRYCLIDKGTMEIMGYAAMTFAIDLLEEICQRLAEFDGISMATAAARWVNGWPSPRLSVSENANMKKPWVMVTMMY